MEDFTLVDGGVAAVILISAILAYSRGLVREVLSIAGWVLAAIVAYIFAPQAEPLVREIPYVNDILSSCYLSLGGAFVLVFAVALLVVSVFTPLFSSMVQNSALGFIDQALGFIFGVARGVLLVLVALILYDIVVPEGDGFDMVENSKSRAVFADSAARLYEMRPSEVPQWLQDRYDGFLGNCDAPVDGSISTETGSDT